MNVRPFVAICLLDGAGNVLLMKRAPWRKSAPNMITGIGGEVEKTDVSIEAALEREFKEETKIPWDGITDLQLKIKLFVLNRDENDYPVYFYTGQVKRAENMDLACNEGDLAWYPIAEVDKLELRPTFRLAAEYLFLDKQMACLYNEQADKAVWLGISE